MPALVDWPAGMGVLGIALPDVPLEPEPAGAAGPDDITPPWLPVAAAFEPGVIGAPLVVDGAAVDEGAPMVEVDGLAGEVTVWSLAVPGRMEGEPAVVDPDPVAVGRSPVWARAGAAARAATRQAVAGFSIVHS